MFMFSKKRVQYFFIIVLTFLSTTILASDWVVEIPNQAVNSKELDEQSFLLSAIKSSIEVEAKLNSLDYNKFLTKLKNKKLSTQDEFLFLKFLIDQSEIRIIEESAIDQKNVLTKKANVSLVINREKTKLLLAQVINDLPDLSKKNLFILMDIAIDSSMSWNDVGVSRKENFTTVIGESWKKWGKEQFSENQFESVVILDHDLPENLGEIHPESYVLKWTSKLKKSFSSKDQKSAGYELFAQYVLLNLRSKDIVLAHDFPTEKRTYSTTNSKTLSSGLASLIYNLLNSQTKKILASFAANKSKGSSLSNEFKLRGPIGLADSYLVINKLNEVFKIKNMTFLMKTYSSNESIILVKSNENLSDLEAIFAKDLNRLELNEQKILVFDPADKAFAILLKDVNN